MAGVGGAGGAATGRRRGAGGRDDRGDRRDRGVRRGRRRGGRPAPAWSSAPGRGGLSVVAGAAVVVGGCVVAGGGAGALAPAGMHSSSPTYSGVSAVALLALSHSAPGAGGLGEAVPVVVGDDGVGASAGRLGPRRDGGRGAGAMRCADALADVLLGAGAGSTTGAGAPGHGSGHRHRRDGRGRAPAGRGRGDRSGDLGGRSERSAGVPGVVTQGQGDRDHQHADAADGADAQEAGIDGRESGPAGAPLLGLDPVVDRRPRRRRRRRRTRRTAGFGDEWRVRRAHGAVATGAWAPVVGTLVSRGVYPAGSTPAPPRTGCRRRSDRS